MLLLFAFSNNIFSRKLPGYIVTESNDTVYGKVKVSATNPRVGGFSLNQINLETCYMQVAFCEQGASRFKTYEPKEIREYAFKFDGREYFFYRFQILYNSIVKAEENRYELLNLVQRTKTFSTYRSLRYVMDHKDESAHNIYVKTNNVVPSYTYYKHQNGSERIIDHKTQSIEKKYLIK